MTILPLGSDTRAIYTKIERLSNLITRCFNYNSRLGKDLLIDVVRESIEKGIWYPCLNDLDNWSDWERFAALELLVTVIGPQDDVLDIPPSEIDAAETPTPQVEKLTQATQDFVVRLTTICDSVLHAYLLKIADTSEKRHYLHLSCTAADCLSYEDLVIVLNELHKFKIFELRPADFLPYDLHALLAIVGHPSVLSCYLRTFKSDLGRSREYHHDDGLWHACVATGYMRCLRALPNSR